MVRICCYNVLKWGLGNLTTMGRLTRVAFFGASVTEQSLHHATNERTGFVNFFEDELAESCGVSVSRISAGSSDIMDAGIVYVDKVVEMNPDICILDWVTPSLQDCDPRIVQHIYYRLMECDILPVTVLFPRTDRIQREIPIAKEMFRISKEFDLPFFDISEMIGQVDLGDILRDTVHTNSAGAEIYANTIAEILRKIKLPSEPLPKLVKPFQVMKVNVSSETPLSARKVKLDVQYITGSDMNFCLILEQRVGPYSPVLDISAIKNGTDASECLERYSIFDPWCHRERQCIKRITNWLSAENIKGIIITVADQTPRLVQQIEVENLPPAKRHLKPRGDLYIVSDQHLMCSANWS